MRNPTARLRTDSRLRRAAAPVALAAVLAALLLTRGHTLRLDCVSAFVPYAEAGGESMSGMANLDWFARHPARGSNTTAAPKDSFLVQATYFDENGDGTITVIDTAKVVTGDVVLWKWVTGSHTITSGTGSSDPNAGTVFNTVSNSANRTFSFQFNDVGTFPFFCSFHESFNMKGVVVVTQNLASVGPAPLAGGEGFVRPPWPNPTSDRATIRFAQSRPGHVRVSVLDAQGRRLAVPFEGDAGAGTFESRWNGRDAAGALAPAGVYFVRLELAGRAQTRRLTLVR